MFSFMGLMDAVSIFPSLVDQLREGEHKQSSLPFIRFVRVLRLLRLMRLVRAAGSHSVSGPSICPLPHPYPSLTGV